MRRIKFLVLAAVCLGFLSNIVAAEDNKETNIRNIEAVYSKLYDLGLPHVKGAKYVKIHINDRNNILMSSFPADHEINQNVWLVKENPEGKSEFVILGSLKVECSDYSRIEKELQEKLKTSKEEKSYEEIQEIFQGSARWENADFRQNLKEICLSLEKNIEDSYGLGKEPASLGRLFILCAQAKENGIEKEYSDLLNKVMDLSDDPETLLKDAVLAMAKARAVKATADFAEKQDMKKYCAELKDIAGKYAEYCDVSQLEEICTVIDKQLASPAIPEISGEALTEQDKKLAKDLVDISLKQYELEGIGLWLVKNENPGAGYNKSIENIISLKAKAFPLLSALLGDDYLTNSIDSTLNFRMTSDENKNAVVAVLPVTRGEIAKKLLTNVLFTNSNNEDSDNLSVEDMREQIAELQKRFENKSEEQIALVYLADGNHAQKERSAWYLARTAAKEHNIPEFEEFCLSEDASAFNYSYALEYIGHRKKASESFAKKILEKLEESKLGKNEKKRMIETINSFVSAEKFEDFIEAMVSGKIKANRNLIWRRLYSEDPEFAALIIMGAIKNVKDEDTKFLFFKILENILSPDYRGENMKKGKEFTDKILKSPLWKEFFNDNSICKGIPTLKYGEYASLIYQCIGANPEIYGTVKYDLDWRFSPLCYTFYKLRALSRIEGKVSDEVAELPLPADQVSKEKADEIIKSLESCSSEKEIRDAVSKIGFGYYNAVSATLSRNAGLSKKLAPLSLKITEIRGVVDDAVKAEFKEFEGRNISEDMLHKVSEKVKKLYLQDKYVNVYIVRGAGFSGSYIAIAGMEGRKEAVKDRVGVKVFAKNYPLCIELQSPLSYEASDLTKDLLKEVEDYRQSRIQETRKLFYEKFKQNILEGASPVFEIAVFVIFPMEYVEPKNEPVSNDSNEGSEEASEE